MYHPDLFGNKVDHVRGDCETRFTAIKNNVDFTGKSVLDFGCAEGYFGFAALENDADHVTLIDVDEKCLKVINETALEHHYLSKVSTGTELSTDEHFEVIICLDLWPHSQLAHPSNFTNCDVLFISPSGSGDENNPKLLKEASDHFKFVKIIHKGYQNRIIFKCSNPITRKAAA